MPIWVCKHVYTASQEIGGWSAPVLLPLSHNDEASTHSKHTTTYFTDALRFTGYKDGLVEYVFQLVPLLSSPLLSSPLLSSPLLSSPLLSSPLLSSPLLSS